LPFPSLSAMGTRQSGQGAGLPFPSLSAMGTKPGVLGLGSFPVIV